MSGNREEVGVIARGRMLRRWRRATRTWRWLSLSTVFVVTALPVVETGHVATAAPTQTPTAQLLLHHRTEFAGGFSGLVKVLGDTFETTFDQDGLLPLVGDRLPDVMALASDKFDGVATDVRYTIEDGLADAASTGADAIDVAAGALYLSLGPGVAGLGDLAGSDPSSLTILESLSSTYGEGLGILGDRDGDGSVTPADVGTTLTMVDGQPEIEFAVAMAQAFTVSVPFALGLELDPDKIVPDFGLPNTLPGGVLDAKSSVQVDLGWDTQLKFGVSTADGFYIPDAIDPVFNAGLKATTPNLDIDATVGLFAVRVTDGTPQNGVTQNSEVRYGVSLKLEPAEGSIATRNRMYAARAVPHGGAGLSGQLRLHVEPRTELRGFSVDGVPVELPEVTFDIEAEIEEGDDGSLEVSSLRFDDISLDIKRLLNTLGRLMGKFAERALRPITEMGNALDAPIPAISDMVGTVTLGDMLPDEAEDLFDRVAELGDLETQFANAAASAPSSFNFGCVDVVNTLPDQKFGPCVGAGYNLQFDSAISNGIVEVHLTKLEEVISLLAGSRTDLVSVGLPNVDVRGGADFEASVYGNGFDVRGELDVKSDLRLVYDTTGLEQMLAQVRSGQEPDPELLVDGMYVQNNATGFELGVVTTFAGSFSTRVKELGVEVLSVGASVDVEASLGFELIDPNRDGQLRYAEMSAISDGFRRPQNLLCLFDFQSGFRAEVSAHARVAGVGVDAGLGWLGGNISIQDLLNGATGCASIVQDAIQGNEVLASQVRVDREDWLRLNVGAYSAARRFGDTDDTGGATVSARSDGDDIVVSFRGVEQRFANENGGPFRGVVAYGGVGPDSIDLRAITLPVSIDGGEGDDVLRAGTDVATIGGGPGNDQIFASPVGDELRGDTGDDTIVAGNGADQVSGGGGDDTIDGGEGDDGLDGASGNDIIRGGTGIDDLAGGSGDDTIEGGAGDDIIRGGPGNDTLDGDDGNDVLDGGGGDDTMRGGNGADRLDGGAADDDLSGGPGDDTVDGSTGDDTRVSGDAGDDVVLGGNGDDDLFGGDGDDLLDGGAGDDSAAAGDGDDHILGGAGDDSVLSGGAGDDMLLGGPGDDTLLGDAGDDVLDGRQGNDIVNGGDDDDVLVGDVGDDRLDGGAGDDRLQGDDGNDTVHARTGTDTALGGAGDDLVSGGDGDDLVEGGPGDDRLFGGVFDTVRDPGLPDSDVILGGPGDDEITAGDDDDLVDGGADDDTITGGSGNDMIDGKAGDDDLDGGFGEDTVRGGAGNDEVAGGPNNDRVSGGADDDTVNGGSGDDLVEGGPGSDTVTGSFGRDTVRGDDGPDNVIGALDDAWLDAGGNAGDLVTLDNREVSSDAVMTGNVVSIPGFTDLLVYGGADTVDVIIDGDDALEIQATALPTNVELIGSSVNVFGANGPLSIEGSSLTPAGSRNDAFILAYGAVDGVNVTVEEGRVAGLFESPVTHSGLDRLWLATTEQVDHIEVLGTDVATTIAAGDGDDTILIDLPAEIRGLMIDGGVGFDTGAVRIDGDPSSVDGLPNTGFNSIERLDIDGSDVSNAAEWEFTDASVSAGGNELIASTVGAEVLRYLGDTDVVNSLSVTDTANADQRVAIGGDSVVIDEAVDVFEFESFTETAGAALAPNPLPDDRTIVVGPDGVTAANLAGESPAVQSLLGWQTTDRVSPNQAATGFGVTIDAFGLSSLIAADVAPTASVDNVSDTSLFARGDAVDSGDVLTVVGDSQSEPPSDVVEIYRGVREQNVTSEFGGFGQFEAVATTGEWIFVGDPANDEVRAYTYDGLQFLEDRDITDTDFNAINSAVRPFPSDPDPDFRDFAYFAESEFGTQTGQIGPFDVFWQGESGASVYRELPDNGLPVTELSFRTDLHDPSRTSTPVFSRTPDDNPPGFERTIAGDGSIIYTYPTLTSEPISGRFDVYLHPVDPNDPTATLPKVRVDQIPWNSAAPSGRKAVTLDVSEQIQARGFEIQWVREDFTLDGPYVTNNKVAIYRTDIEFGTGSVNFRSTITAPDPSATSTFGSVLDASAGRLVVADPGLGEVSIHENARNQWPLTTTVSAGADDAEFGAALSMHNEQLLVGVPGHSIGADVTGRAVLYEFGAGALTELASFTAPDAANGDEFGAAVDVDSDTGVAIGAPGRDIVGPDAGMVWVAAQQAGWKSLVAVPTPSPQPGERCGEAVYLSPAAGAPARVDVGCPRYDIDGGTTDAGIVRTHVAQAPGADAAADGGGAATVLVQPAFEQLALSSRWLFPDRAQVIDTIHIPGLASTEGRDLIAAQGTGTGGVVVANGTTISLVPYSQPGFFHSFGTLVQTTVPSDVVAVSGAPFLRIVLPPVDEAWYVITSDGTLRWFDDGLVELGFLETGLTDATSLTALPGPTGDGQLVVGGDDRALVFDLVGGTPLPIPALIENGTSGVRGLDKVRGAIFADGHLILTSRDDDRIVVVERVGPRFEARQTIRNLEGPVSSLDTPIEAFTGTGPGFFVATAGSQASAPGIVAFRLIDPQPEPRRFDVRFDDGIDSLAVTSGERSDTVTIRDIGRPLAVDTDNGRDTAQGEDIVNAALLSADQSLVVRTRGGADSATLRATGDNGVITFDVGAGDDDVLVAGTSQGATTSVDLGTGNDTITAYGDHLDSQVAVTPSTDGGDTLRFSSAGVVTPLVPVLPDGTVAGSANSPVVYEGIEFLDLLSLPVADATPITIAEGDGVTFDATSSIVPAGRTATYAWDIDGDGNADGVSGEQPSLTWTELAGYGIDDDGLYPITVQLTTDRGDTVEATVGLTVTQTDPVIATFTADAASVNEGEIMTFTVDVTDPGDDTIESWTIDWGDGHADTFGALPPGGRIPHRYEQNGVNDGDRTAVVTITTLSDEDGTYPQTGVEVPLTIVESPVEKIELAGTGTVDEGVAYTLTINAEGLLTPTSSTLIDWGDGTIEEIVLAGAAAQATHVYDGPQVFAVNVLGNYLSGSPVEPTQAHTVTVAGVAPTITMTGVTSSVEGAYTLGLSATELADDTVTHWDVDFGDGSPIVSVRGETPTLTHVFDGPATPRIVATAHDEDGATSASRDVVITNAAPVLGTPVVSGGITEGSSAAIAVAVTDTDRVTFELRDSAGAVIAANRSGNFSVVIPDDGVTTYSIIATDDDGATDTAPVMITTTNVPPIVDVSAPASVLEGSPWSVTLSVTDPGSDIATSVTVDFGDGPVSVPVLNGAAVASHVFDDGPAAASMTVVSVTDEDGVHAVGSVHLVEVLDVAPRVDLTVGDYVAAGDPLDLVLSAISDPGDDVVTSVTVDWGDGSSDVLVAAPDGTRSAQHTYAADVDVAMVAVVVTTDEGAQPPVSRAVDVGRAPVASDDSFTVAEDDVTNFDVAPAVTDPDGDLDLGTLLIVDAPGFATTSIIDGVVRYTPTTDFNGADFFDYEVCDVRGLCDIARVDVTVDPTADLPLARPDVLTITESTSGTVDVTTNDDDPDVGPVQLLSVDTGSSGLDAELVAGTPTAVSVAPAGRFEQLAEGESIARMVEYTIGGVEGTATGQIDVTIIGENDAPSATPDRFRAGQNDEVTLEPLLNDIDVDNGDALTIVDLADAPSTVAITDAGTSLAFSPGTTYTAVPAGEEFIETFTYTVEDSAGLRSTETVTLVVVGIDELPVVAATGGIVLDLVATEDEPLRFEPADLLVDADGESIEVLSFDTTTAEGGSVVEGSLIYDPAANFHGNDRFTFVARGGTGIGVEFVVELTVEPVADAPQLLVDGQPVERTAIVLGALVPSALTLFDADGDTVTVEVSSGSIPDGLMLQSDGTFAGVVTSTTPTTATLELCDDTGLCSDVVVDFLIEATQLPATGTNGTHASVRLAGLILAAGLAALLLASRRRRGALVGAEM